MVCIEEPTASAIVSLSSRGTNLKALGHCGLGLALQKPRHSKAAHLLQNAMVKTPGIAVGGHVHVLLIGTDVPKLRKGEYEASSSHANAVTAVGGQAIAYDGNGAVTQSLGRSFEWAADGKLRRVTGPKATLDYGYDYAGQRAVKKVTTGAKESTTLYLGRYSEVRDGQLVKYVFVGDTRIARIGGSTPRAVEVASLVTGPGASAVGALALLAALALLVVRPVRRFARGVLAVSLSLFLASCGTCGGPLGPPAGTLFYVANHLGTTVLQLDVDSKVTEEVNFDVWGNPIVLSDEAYGYTGAEYDAEAGLQYLGTRYYDVKLGRFLSVDAYVLDKPEVGAKDSQLLNVYAYARGSPAGYKDPNGQCAEGVDGPACTLSDFVGGVLSGIAEGIYPPSANLTPGGESTFQTGRAVGLLATGIAQALGGQGLSTVGGEMSLAGAATAPAGVGIAVMAGGAAVTATGVGITALGALNVGKGLNLLMASKGGGTTTHQTYTKTNPKTGEVYSGRTRGTGTPEQNIARRNAKHHMNKEGFGPAALDKSSTNKDAIRGREQQLIDANGGSKRSGGTSGNAINGIAPTNPKGPGYRAAAAKEFK